MWVRCEQGDTKSVRCWMWNGSGVVLESGRFLPLDGGDAPTPAALKEIDRDGRYATNQITLKSTRILVPEARFDELKALNERNEEP